MPQIKLEYSANLQIETSLPGLFSKIHNLLNKTCGIPILNCKSRALKLENYFVGNGHTKSAFAHLEIALLEGRNQEIKEKLAVAVLQILKREFLPVVNKNDLQITVEIKEIKRDSYIKYPEGSMSTP